MTGRCHVCNCPARFPLNKDEGDRAWSWLEFTPTMGEMWWAGEEQVYSLWKPMHWCCIPMWEALSGRRLKQQEVE